MVQNLPLIVIGIVVSLMGTFMGIGGGFILVPILVFAFPQFSPMEITSISLATLCANAFSGSINYMRRRRVVYRYAILLSLTSLPGAFLGPLVTPLFDRRIYQTAFAVLLMVLAILVFSHLRGAPSSETKVQELQPITLGKIILISILGSIIGFISTLIGIGGGLFYVPLLIYMFKLSAHQATATSLFALVFVTLTGFLMHLSTTNTNPHLGMTLYLALGAIIGSQIGAKLSSKAEGTVIIKSLGILLGLTGALMLAQSFYPS